jgi:hypothetical protein
LRKKKNRTIIETTNATKHDQNLSRIPWEEACMTVYVQNKSLHQNLKNITPEEVFTRMKPEIEHFRLIWVPNVFSCTQREEVQARSFRRKDTMNLQRHP